MVDVYGGVSGPWIGHSSSVALVELTDTTSDLRTILLLVACSWGLLVVSCYQCSQSFVLVAMVNDDSLLLPLHLVSCQYVTNNVNSNSSTGFPLI